MPPLHDGSTPPAIIRPGAGHLLCRCKSDATPSWRFAVGSRFHFRVTTKHDRSCPRARAFCSRSYDRAGLVRVDRAFVAHLAASDVTLHDRLMAGRSAPDAIEHQTHSDLLVDLAPHLEDFIGELFGIDAEVRALQARHHELAPLYSVKRLFVQRRAVKGVKEADATELDGPRLAG